MDLTPPITNATATATTSTSTKSPEPDNETPTRILSTKPLSFSNGVLKRNVHPISPFTYRECLKNHAASLGGHALDGCGEFMPSPSATTTDPTSLKCAACGCHRNFHRRESEEPISTTHVIEYQPLHRHHPPPPAPLQPLNRSPSSASPPPISSSYYPSAPHMLLALSAGLSAPPESAAGLSTHPPVTPSPGSRKRFRTKFSQDQKEKMHQFAERVGWKIQKRDEELINGFCSEIGVERGVLKVWMHNNKNTFAKREANGVRINIVDDRHGQNDTHNDEMNGNDNGSGRRDPGRYESDGGANGGINGSSSSS